MAAPKKTAADAATPKEPNKGLAPLKSVVKDLAMFTNTKLAGWLITRVPGGYIYQQGTHSCFVPNSDEAISDLSE